MPGIACHNQESRVTSGNAGRPAFVSCRMGFHGRLPFRIFRRVRCCEKRTSPLVLNLSEFRTAHQSAQVLPGDEYLTSVFQAIESVLSVTEIKQRSAGACEVSSK